MYWRISKTTVKTLLMEVFIVSTPTYSGNYKASLEGFLVQSQRHASAPDRAGLAM
jgi:hypothetical protein